MVTHGWVEGMVHASDARRLGQISASAGEGGEAPDSALLCLVSLGGGAGGWGWDWSTLGGGEGGEEVNEVKRGWR